jgi:YYY domain-containing protein
VRLHFRADRTAPVVFLALMALLAAGAFLRLSHLNWDASQHVHPDERFIVWVASTMTLPATPAEALDPQRSTLNPFRWPANPKDPSDPLAGTPRNYAYGHFPLYLLVGAANAGEAISRWLGETKLALPAFLQPLHTGWRSLTTFEALPPVGRAISAVADLGTLLLVFLLGRKIYGHWAGLLSAAAYTFAVLAVQLSHFATVDALLTLLVLLSVAFAARFATRGGWPALLCAGVAAGLAVGTKFSAVLLAVPVLAAALYRLPEGTRGRQALFVIGRCALAGAAALLAFLVTNPFAIVEPQAYVGQILAQNAMVSGAMDAPYARQYLGTLPFLYFVKELSHWGLGWPLGVLGWAGLAWGTVRALRRRAMPAEVVLLAWALPYFAITGGFHAKFLRYMLPLTPFLLVFGSGLAVAGWRWLATRYGRAGRVAWGAAAGVTILFTLGWTAAFTRVYDQEHPWIRASRQFVETVPDGAVILTEHWDDALPLAMEGLPARRYERIELPLWEEDGNEKLDTLVEALSRADYVILASNRLSGPLPRLRIRYPMTSHYHALLVAGDLGYRQVAEFTSYPRLGGLEIPDDNADESFTVYDHPRAVVFRNEARLSPGQLRARLGRYLPLGTGMVPEPAPDARGRAHGLARARPQVPAPGAPLTLSQPVDTLPVVNDFRWNQVALGSAPLAAVLWWLVVSLFGWLAWPLLFPLLPGLGDRGHGVARAAGWLMVGYAGWIGASLGWWENRLATHAVALWLLGAGGVAALVAQRREIGRWVRTHGRLVLAQEALFAAAFGAFVIVRLLNPDLWQPWNGGEKFMESAFLNATLRSAAMPPYDPYFAGGILNYYYYGLYLVGIPIKLTGIAPEMAFNLAVPTFFALTALGAFSIARNLAGGLLAREHQAGGRNRAAAAAGGGSIKRSADFRPDGPPGAGAPNTMAANVAPAPDAPLLPAPVPDWAAGWLAMLFAVLLGNLRGLGWLANRLGDLVRGREGARFDYWASSRVIPNTINEFPLWTFVFADLHPHLMAMPFGLLAVTLGLNYVQRWETADDERRAGGEMGAGLGELGGRLLIVLALGAVAATNTWDLPTYGLVIVAILMFSGWRRGGLVGALAAAALGATLVALAAAAYWPFFASYRVQVGAGAGSVVARFLAAVRAPSPLSPWLNIWAIFLFFGASYALVTVASLRGGPSGARRLLPWLGAAAALALLAALDRAPAAIALAPVLLLIPAMARRHGSAAESTTALLMAGGLAVVAGTELVYLRDFLEGGDWYRMNTLFKFSVPAWLLMGVAAGVAVPQMWQIARSGARAGGGRAALGWAWRAASVFMIGGGLVFLAAGVRERVDDRFPGARPPVGTLDGAAYMTVGTFTWPRGDSPISLPEERAAISWLLDNVSGSPVVAEAPAGGYTVSGEQVGYDYYRAMGLRVASLTGFPTFLGQHQYEQRPGEQVGERGQAAQRFFATPSLEETRRLMRELRVGYVYVGRLERILFGDEALSKFDEMAAGGELDVVYSNPEVTIYRVAI